MLGASFTLDCRFARLFDMEEAVVLDAWSRTFLHHINIKALELEKADLHLSEIPGIEKRASPCRGWEPP